jgi:MFS family permease
LIKVALALMTWGIGEEMFYFFQPLYLQELGADPQEIGNTLGMVMGVMAVSYLPAGLLADRFGRRPLIHSAWVIATLATALMAFAATRAVFVAGMIVYGVTGFVTVPLNSYVTAARGRWSVGRTLTLISACFNLGSIIGPLIGGWVAARVGLAMNFRIAMALFVISTVIIFLIRPQPVESGEAAGAGGRLRMLLDRRFLRYVALMFLMVFGLYLSQPLTQNFLQNERGVDIQRIGQLIAARSLGIVVLSLALGQLNARVGLLTAQAAMLAYNALIWLGTGFPAYLAGYFLMGSYMVARNLSIAQSRSLIQSGNMGAAYGVLEMAMSTAMVVGPPLAGFLYEQRPEWMYIAALAVVGVGLAANLVFSPVRRKDLQTFEDKEKAQWAGS